jgi:hypothetical protein
VRPPFIDTGTEEAIISFNFFAGKFTDAPRFELLTAELVVPFETEPIFEEKKIKF